MIMLKLLQSHYKRFMRFACVGVLNTGLDILIFSIFFYGLGLHYLLAHCFGFLFANANSFLLNFLWTFDKKTEGPLYKKFTVFFMVSVVGLMISSAALHLFVVVASPVISLSLYPHLWGKVFASGIALIWNYFGSWIFVFKDKT